METSAYIHFPAELATQDARLFWLLANALEQGAAYRELDNLLSTDWSPVLGDPQTPEMAAQLALAFFKRDDEQRLSALCEGFDPRSHPSFFQTLIDAAQTQQALSLAEQAQGVPAGPIRRCHLWLVSQGLLGEGLDGFKRALWRDDLERAKTLHTLSAAEAEALFYEKPQALSKDGTALLFFFCPTLANHRALEEAMSLGAPEENLLFIAWKMERALSKPELRYPDGNEEKLVQLLRMSLADGHGALSRKILDWNPALAHELLTPDRIRAPWPNDTRPLRLDGTLTLSAAEFACLHGLDGLARNLRALGATAPNLERLIALLPVFASALEKRFPGTASSWIQSKSQAMSGHCRNLWS